MKKTINVENAVRPVGPYSHAVEANGFIYLSGQGPSNPITGCISTVFEEQVKQTFTNLETILKGCGTDFVNVVKVNVYLSDLSLFEKFNAIYKMYFPNDYPARTTVGATLMGIMVEIDCVAAR